MIRMQYSLQLITSENRLQSRSAKDAQLMQPGRLRDSSRWSERSGDDPDAIFLTTPHFEESSTVPTRQRREM